MPHSEGPNADTEAATGPGIDALCLMPATELAGRLQAGEVSAREVLNAHLDRIENANPALNAIITLLPDQALERATALDEAFAKDGPVGPLHGLPIAHKDLLLTAGVRTTFGSPIFADFVPEQDALLAQRTREAGAVMIGKTNVPEFGAGSQTFNPLFGPTRNPHDPSRTAGGSSGGAAAALAAGMIPVADGSDLGGSLRNPASFCGVVGFRPSVGRVPHVPEPVDPDSMAVLGPLGRTVADTALLFSVIAGPDAREPGSRPEPGPAFAPPLDSPGRRRIAFAPAADGEMPFEPEVVTAVEAARARFEGLGELAGAFPELAGAREVFLTLRAKGFAQRLRPCFPAERGQMKDTVVWEVERGLALTDKDLARARAARRQIDMAVSAFFERFDALVLPVSQVVPFPVEMEWPSEVAGHPTQTYIDWMASCWKVTVTGCPSIAVPCGRTPAGLPVGLQIVTAPGNDLGALRLAAAFERARGPLGPVPCRDDLRGKESL
jgi:amidase